jgi:hypothetical protein
MLTTAMSPVLLMADSHTLLVDFIGFGNRGLNEVR